MDQHDRRARARAAFVDLDLAAGEVEDATSGFGHRGRLGFAVGDQGVDQQQRPISATATPIPIFQPLPMPVVTLAPVSEKFVIEGGVPLSGS